MIPPEKHFVVSQRHLFLILLMKIPTIQETVPTPEIITIQADRSFLHQGCLFRAFR